MTTPEPSSYDELPYDDLAFYHTHPSNLAVVAALCGLAAPALEACRVLELGCGSGYNLLAMRASLPGARLVGVDGSARRIERGRAMAAAAGVEGVELVAADLTRPDAGLGTFDYVLAHGLLSSVSAAVRGAVLDVCKRHLAPDGLAYVSYNTYPGWHLRAVLRDVLLFHAPKDVAPRERVRQARAGLARTLAELPEPEGNYAQLLRAAAAAIADDTDGYVFHEYLESDNQPLRFDEFAALASARGLQFLSEARYVTNSFAQRGAVAQAVNAASDDLVRREQYLDLLRNRTFRQSLLCHADVQASRWPSAPALARLHARAQVEPISADGEQEQFRLGDGRVIGTGDRLLRGVLHRLGEAWPATVSVEELGVAVFKRYGVEEAAEQIPPVIAVGPAVVHGYMDGLWSLFGYAPPFRPDPGERPRAGGLARHVAADRGWVTNLLHVPVELDAEERALLRRLDGRTPPDALASGLGCTREDVERRLRRLAESALLV